METWESAEKVQKNDAGEYRALMGGQWVPVAKAQKNDAGQFRVMRSVAAPAPIERTFGEEAARQGGMVLRNALSAVTSPVHLGASVLNKAINAAAGRQVFDPNPSANFEAAMTNIGLPKPTGGIEQFGSELAKSAPAFALPATLPAQIGGAAAMGSAQAAPGEELEGAALGGGFAGAVGAIPVVGKPIAKFAGKFAEPLTEAGRTRAMQTKIREVLGNTATDEVAGMIAQYAKPGMSVADVIAEANKASVTKTGAPLVKLEQVLGGQAALADAAKSKAAQDSAALMANIESFAGTPAKLEKAIAARKAVTDPMRTSALEGANTGTVAKDVMNQFGAWEKQVSPSLLTDNISASLRSIKSAPGNRANATVQSAMNEIDTLMKGAVNEKGVVPAEELYTLRKQAGNVIKKYADENKSWDQRFTSGLLSDVQKAIDDSLEAAAGNTGGWKRYLDVYSKRSRGINQMKGGQELLNALRSETGVPTPGSFGSKVRGLEGEMETTFSAPQQRKIEATVDLLRRGQEKKALASGVDVGDFTTVGKGGEIPHMLSTPATIANLVLKMVGQDATKKISKDVGKMMIEDPSGFSKKYLTKLPPDKAAMVIEEMRKFAPAQYAAVQSMSSEE